jgi:hypothetical protein
MERQAVISQAVEIVQNFGLSKKLQTPLWRNRLVNVIGGDNGAADVGICAALAPPAQTGRT